MISQYMNLHMYIHDMNIHGIQDMNIHDMNTHNMKGINTIPRLLYLKLQVSVKAAASAVKSYVSVCLCRRR